MTREGLPERHREVGRADSEAPLATEQAPSAEGSAEEGLEDSGGEACVHPEGLTITRDRVELSKESP